MILHGSVYSSELEMETGITIVTPTKYHHKSPYQVCYLLHGLCGSHTDMVNYTALPVLANQYHCIFVMPAVARSFYTDMATGQNYFSYVAKELPQICESLFQISAKPEDTSVIGVSMGGYGALKCALTFPERYGSCCAISPGCLFLQDFLAEMKQRENDAAFVSQWGRQFIRDFRAAFGEDFSWSTEIELLELAKQAAHVGHIPAVYQVCGAEDGLVGLNRQFAEQAKGLLPRYTYEEWEGTHDWAFFGQALEKALAFAVHK